MSSYLKIRNKQNFRKSSLQKPIWERSEHRYSRFRRNLWSLVLFLLISIDAYSFRHFNLFEASSEPVRQLLGCPPPAYLISVALAIYGSSAIVLSLTAMATDAPPASLWKQLGYRCSFYLFYSFSGAIAGHYLPVLIIGLGLYALDQLHIGIYNHKTVQEQKELLERF